MAGSHRPVDDVAADLGDRHDEEQQDKPAKYERKRDGARPALAHLFVGQHDPRALVALIDHAATPTAWTTRETSPSIRPTPTSCSASRTAKSRNRYRIEKPNSLPQALRSACVSGARRR